MSEQSEIKTYRVPADVASVADQRWGPVFREYMRRWSHYHAALGYPKLPDLCRALYLQGLLDGYDARESELASGGSDAD